MAGPQVVVSGEPGPASERLRERVWGALREVIDPELGLNVVDLGLVYGVDVEAASLRVRLTMTTPACPLGEHIARDAERRVLGVEGVDEAHVELVWEPAWAPGRMSPGAKEALGWGVPQAGPGYDAALHGVFLGYVLSMVFAHAPIILPAVARVELPFHPSMYAALAALHGGLLARVVGDLAGHAGLRSSGAVASAVSLGLFAAAAIRSRATLRG